MSQKNTSVKLWDSVPFSNRASLEGTLKMDHTVTQEISWENSRVHCWPYIANRSFFG